MSFRVVLERYEGPYEALLNLVEKNKLSITEVNLGLICDEYIKYIEKNNIKDLHELTTFINVASSLLLLKIKSMLPASTSVEEKKVYTDISAHIRVAEILRQAKVNLNKSRSTDLYFIEAVQKKQSLGFMPLQRVDKMTFYSIVLLRNLQNKLVKELIHTVSVEKKEPLKDVMERVKAKIDSLGTINFHSIIKDKEKKEVISIFLALLHLINQHNILYNEGDLTSK